ncbi:MAG: magnesium transporter MgtE N-terminal domain-containing protein [Pirellulaceae bacterium]
MLAFAESSPEAAAAALEKLDPDEAAPILDRLPPHASGLVVERRMPHAAAAILIQLGTDRTKTLWKTITPRQAAALLQHLEDVHRDAVLAHLPATESRRLRALIQYPPETAGGMMEPQIVPLAIALTVQEAIAARLNIRTTQNRQKCSCCLRRNGCLGVLAGCHGLVLVECRF